MNKRISTRLLAIITLISFFGNGIIAQNKNKTENVVLILIDGYRWQELFRGAEKSLLADKSFNSEDSTARFKKYWDEDPMVRRKKLMPFTWDYIATHGQIYGNRDLGNLVEVTNPYWISYPGRAELYSGFVDPSIKSNGHPNNPNINVLEYIHNQKGFKGSVAAFVCWRPAGLALNMENASFLVNVPWDDVKGDKLTEAQKLANELQHYAPLVFGYGERLDFAVYGLASSYIKANHPRVTYIDLGDTDEYAHEGHYDKYLDDIHNIDKMIGNLWHSMQADEFYKGKTTFVIVTDHGRGEGNEWIDHYHTIPHSGETWAMILGPESKALGEVKTPGKIYQNQFAATIARLLNLEYTAEGRAGKPVESMIR